MKSRVVKVFIASIGIQRIAAVIATIAEASEASEASPTEI